MKTYASVFGDRAPVDPKAAPAAITAKLAEFGVELSSAGANGLWLCLTATSPVKASKPKIECL